MPNPDDLDLNGIGGITSRAKVADAIEVDRADWTAETALIDQWYAKIGRRLPDALREELTALKSRLAADASVDGID